jgi:sugar phosphate isomerase/epimerase
VAIVEALGERAPLLHIKDGPLDSEKDMQAIGEGAMDIPPIIEASHGTCDWLIVELDRCGSDMMEAVENSYDYLVGNELARGAR